jgi:hypothetical protein
MSDHSASDSNTNILHRLEEILADIKTLLDYLGRLDHGRLQAHFDDTRSAATETVPLRAVPPCHTYAGFLARLAWLGTSIRKGQWPADPMPKSSVIAQPPLAGQIDPAATQPRVEEPLADVPFLIWSRDFLASVASPATVETIEITRAYVDARARHRIWLWLQRLIPVRITADNGTGNHPPPPNPRPKRRPDEARSGRTLHGARLATSVSIVEVLALLATFVALITSTYVLSGQTILNQKQTQAASYATVKQQIEVAAESLPLSDRRAVVDPISLCTQAVTPAQTIVAAMGSMVPPATLKPASDGTEPSDQGKPFVKLGYFCHQEHEARVLLNATRTSLEAWVRVITRPHDLPIVAIPMTRLAALFGDVSEMPRDGVIPVNTSQREPTDEPTSTTAVDLLERSGTIAQSILSAVSLYLMPCLYGLIGAAAATLRMLRRKVDAATLGYTDRGGVKQNLILGVMCGATIGLFAGYILGASSTQGLGLSALALLAGYNVSGVLAFLDELSARLFRPIDTATGKG